jgi:hypothetical protein
MSRILLLALALVLFIAPARAQDDDLAAGFHLGKFYTTASLIATDLLLLGELVNQLGLENITQENYDAGDITDEDLNNANMVLAYAVWRLQFLIMPASEAGLDADSFSHPVMADFKEPTQAILTEIQRLGQEYLDSPEWEDLVAMTDSISEGEYVEDLYALAEQARDAAGVEE